MHHERNDGIDQVTLDMADPLPEARLARRWGISPRTMQRKRGARDVPPWFRIGRTVVYPWPGILAFEAAAMAREEQ